MDGCSLLRILQLLFLCSQCWGKNKKSAVTYKSFECLKTPYGFDYQGHQFKTKSGRKCQNWWADEPHKPGCTAGGPGSYCRNPYGPGIPSSLCSSKQPWCYTTDPNKLWEVCDIPLCSHGVTPGIPLSPPLECYVVHTGPYYKGLHARTESGRTCQAWRSTKPHHHSCGMGGPGNYCRNPWTPDNQRCPFRKRPWCYTTDPRKEWEYCPRLPRCLSSCNPNPCRNGGHCELTRSATGTSYFCVCYNGYSGLRCTETGVATNCYPNPCKNHGICIMDDKKHRGYWYCYCTDGYTGKYCDKPPRICNPNPCKHEGICFAVGGYLCGCRHGYTGKHCNIAVRGCHPNPCKNGGNCYGFSANSGYSCVCNPGYTGKYCEHPPPACNPNPCQFGGSCMTYPRTGLHWCECELGHTGYNCEDSIQG